MFETSAVFWVIGERRVNHGREVATLAAFRATAEAKPQRGIG